MFLAAWATLTSGIWCSSFPRELGYIFHWDEPNKCKIYLICRRKLWSMWKTICGSQGTQPWFTRMIDYSPPEHHPCRNQGIQLGTWTLNNPLHCHCCYVHWQTYQVQSVSWAGITVVFPAPIVCSGGCFYDICFLNHPGRMKYWSLLEFGQEDLRLV